MNENLAFEAAYLNLGSPEDTIAPDTTLEVETDGFAPYIVGTLALRRLRALRQGRLPDL